MERGKVNTFWHGAIDISRTLDGIATVVIVLVIVAGAYALCSGVRDLRRR